MTREQFEAHVRAEAMREHPDETPGIICIGDIHAASKRSAYIAARMENEWKLVEALQSSKTAITHERQLERVLRASGTNATID